MHLITHTYDKIYWQLAFIGYVIFAESPDKWTWFGGIVIFASVIYITYREAFIKQRDPSTKQINRAIIN